MADMKVGPSENQGAISGLDQEAQNQRERIQRKGGRDDTLDDELERERLEPGLNSEGTGGAGADPDGPHDGGNSNT